MTNSTSSSPPQSIPRTKRKSTGKRLRFEVFKRDGFTCQYCGAQPPGVVLVVDHIHPVSKGGDNDPLNLITACEPCNQGKADKVLDDRIVRPDADLLYLEAKQEAAEIRRYQEALLEKEEALADYIGDLQNLWQDWSGLDWAPAEKVIRTLLARHDASVVEDAIRDVAGKVGSGYVKSYGDAWVRYLHAVARNMSSAEEDM